MARLIIIALTCCFSIQSAEAGWLSKVCRPFLRAIGMDSNPQRIESTMPQAFGTSLKGPISISALLQDSRLHPLVRFELMLWKDIHKLSDDLPLTKPSVEFYTGWSDFLFANQVEGDFNDIPFEFGKLKTDKLSIKWLKAWQKVSFMESADRVFSALMREYFLSLIDPKDAIYSEVRQILEELIDQKDFVTATLRRWMLQNFQTFRDVSREGQTRSRAEDAIAELTALKQILAAVEFPESLARQYETPLVYLAIESGLSYNESLSPSVDIILTGGDRPAGFFEVKRAKNIRSAQDVSLLVKSTIEKIAEPLTLEYFFGEKHRLDLSAEWGIKGLILIVDWNFEEAVEWKRGPQRLQRSPTGEVSIQIDQNRKVDLETVFDDILNQLDRIPESQKLNFISIVDKSGFPLLSVLRNGPKWLDLNGKWSLRFPVESKGFEISVGQMPF